MAALDPTEYERRFLAAVAETKTAGIWFSNAVPPYVRILRKFGQRPIPPHYAPMRQTLLAQFLYFTVAWGILMWFFVWQGNASVGSAMVGAVLAGVIFALGMAAYLSFSRKSNKLTKWDDL